MHYPKELDILKEYIQNFGYDFITDFKLCEYSNIIRNYFDNGHLLESSIIDFGQSRDGGIYAIWNNNDEQKIVYLGSEGSDWYILTNNIQDFLVLLSIGYENILEENLKLKPIKKQNNNLKKWIKAKLNITVPNTAKNISQISDNSFVEFLHHKLKSQVSLEEFNPNSEYNNESHYIQYRLVIESYPKDKLIFIKKIRKVSQISISDLLKIEKFPFVVYQNNTSFNGKLKLRNFNSSDKDYLIDIIENYSSNIKLEYRNSAKKSELKKFQKLN